MISAENLQLECVRCNEEDAKQIMLWRNDPETLKWSFHTEPKIWESFWPKFKQRYFSFPELPPLFTVLEGKRVAFLHLVPSCDPEEVNARTAEISIVVDPKMRGKGIGVASLNAIAEWAALQKYSQIIAKVKIENTASQRTFIKAGFTQIAQETEEIFDTGEQVEIFKYLLKTDYVHKLPPRVRVIAEAGSNWVIGKDRSENRQAARALIKAAAEAGADAVKFQLFRANTIYVAQAGPANYLSKSGINEDMSTLFQELEIPDELVPQLAEWAREFGIELMISPFSTRDFQMIDRFVKVHKIASYEIGHIRLLEAIAQTQKPVYMSTGAATPSEIEWSVNFLRSHHCGPITLLQCTASYPAPVEDINLATIPWLKERYQTEAGLSDHSADPLAAPVAAVALGAAVIEKHFTLNRLATGPDHRFAITPTDLHALVRIVRLIERMRGERVKKMAPSESELREFSCRGLQAIQTIRPGDLFQEDSNFAILRPGQQTKGIHPRYLEFIQGQPAKREIAPGQGIQMGDW